MTAADHERLITIGRFGAPYGVKGWVKVHSFTDPIDNIFTYQPWLAKLGKKWQEIKLTDFRKHNKGLIVAIAGCDNRDTTVLYRNATIAVKRAQLPSLNTGEYYWTDLKDLMVHTVTGDELGKVNYIFATGANDVLVVKGKREYLIPYLQDSVIKTIDLQSGKIIVDWDANF